MVQLSYPYMTTEKTIALIIWTVSKVMSLLINTPSRFTGLIHGSGRYPEVENGNQHQYSCLENYMDRVA